MRPEETGGFPDMTLKMKYYFGKCERKIGKSKTHFLTYSLEFNFRFVFHSLTQFWTNMSFLPKSL